MPVEQPWTQRYLGLSGWRQWAQEAVLYVSVLASAILVPSTGNEALLVFAFLLTPVTLFLRRRFPATSLVLGGLALGLVVVPLAFNAGRRIESLPKLLGAAFAFIAISNITSPLYGESTIDSALMLAFSLALQLWLLMLPAVLGRSSARRAMLVNALHDRAVYLERERRSVIAEARMRERTRIAVDMHDSLGHHLTLISLQAGGLKLAGTANPAQAEAAGVLHDTARRAMEELREIIGVLGQENGDDAPLHARRLEQLPDLLASARHSGATVSWQLTGQEVELPTPIENAVYRVTQEGLTNALRHAPGGAVTVRLNYESDAVIIEVVNGPAAQAPRTGEGSGQGLTGLRERVRLTGGVLHAAATGGGGFRVAAVLPYESEPGAQVEEDRGPVALASPHPLARTEATKLVATMRDRPVLTGLTVFGLVLCSVLLFFSAVTWVVVRNGHLLPADNFDLVTVGEPETVVLATLGGLPSEGAEKRIAAQTGAAPEGMACRYFYVDGAEDPANRTTTAVRFCFRDGKLARKDRFVVKRPF